MLGLTADTLSMNEDKMMRIRDIFGCIRIIPTNTSYLHHLSATITKFNDIDVKNDAIV